MKKAALLLLIAIGSTGFCQKLYAQRGDAAIGLRATPDGGGFNIKAYLTKNLAFEGQLNAGGLIGGYNGQSFTAVALLEATIVFPDPSWRMFFGGGLHGGVWDQGWHYSNFENRYVDGGQPIFGLDAIVGAEYVFKKIPLSLGVDVKPAINLIGDVEYFPHNMVGATVRYYMR